MTRVMKHQNPVVNPENLSRAVGNRTLYKHSSEYIDFDSV